MPSSPQELGDVAARWLAAMYRGDFEAAWRETDRIELRRRGDEARGEFQFEPSYHLLWDGAPFDGRDVLVRCNHGLGDTVQFVRYVPHVRARARSVVLLVQPHLLRLFDGTREFGDVRNGWSGDPPPPHDVEIEIMELPYAFRSDVATLPRTVPYLPVDAYRELARGLPPLGSSTLRVGLVWAASDWDPTRSIPLDALATLADVAGVEFHALQQGREASEWRAAPFALAPLNAHTAAVEMLAAAMTALDLVITVDCMVGHLAGALARPVWVLLRHDADWRWMTARSDSPWYPTMRLFRQPAAGAWGEVGAAIAAALRELVARVA